MNSMYKIIDSLCKERGITIAALSRETGISKSTMSELKMGRSQSLSAKNMDKVAKFFNVSVGHLLGEEKNPPFPEPEITEDYVTFPVIGEVAAGYERVITEEWSGDTVDIPVSYLHGRPKSDFIVLTVIGNSMYPMYIDGDKVLILKQPTLERSGDIGLVRYDGENATLKKVEYVVGEDWMKLIPLNPEYQPRTIEGADLEVCEIIGVPKLLIREIEQ